MCCLRPRFSCDLQNQIQSQRKAEEASSELKQQIAKLEQELASVDDSSLRDEIQMLTAEVEHYKLLSGAESDSARNAQDEVRRYDFKTYIGRFKAE